MTDCCSPKGYRWVFSERNARSEAKRYRRKGLDPTSRRIVAFLQQHGVQGRTVLEVGGGIGAIQIELLRAGASRAVSVELTSTYEREATALLREAGLEARVERQIMDFAETAAAVDGADIVILNRVICCYPNMPKLAGAAAAHTREVLVLSYPKETWWTRLGLGLATWRCALRAASSRFSCTRPGRSSQPPNSTAFGQSSIELDRSGPSPLCAGPRSSQPAGCGRQPWRVGVVSVAPRRGHRVAQGFALPPTWRRPGAPALFDQRCSRSHVAVRRPGLQVTCLGVGNPIAGGRSAPL